MLRTERRYDPAFGHYPWLARPPHPFTTGDRAAGIRYDFSVPQAEFALTQVFDRPDQGRVFFADVMRENLDLGRPDQVQLIFNRRIIKRTPSRYLANPRKPVLRKSSSVKPTLKAKSETVKVVDLPV